jgi:hypothetical protein
MGWPSTEATMSRASSEGVAGMAAAEAALRRHPSVGVRVTWAPSRSTTMSTWRPALASSRVAKSSKVPTVSPSTLRISSPSTMPASAAADEARTVWTVQLSSLDRPWMRKRLNSSTKAMSRFMNGPARTVATRFGADCARYERGSSAGSISSRLFIPMMRT